MTASNRKKILFLIVIFLAVVPFFWLKPGEMDLGGDSSRLYFYDPYNYFRYNLLYAIVPTGFSIEQPLLLIAPFVGLLILVKKIIPSSYLIITLFNSINLVIAFLAMYGIFNELLSHEKKNRKYTIFLAAIFTGLYYVFSPIMVRTAWDKALTTHAQIFLNPLVFYLLLRYVRTNKILYLLVILIITVVFSVNFSWAASPILLGFYLFAMLFLFFYTKITGIKFRFFPILLTAVFFIFLHAFHYVPFIMQILDKSGAAFARTFTSQNQYDIGLSYFVGIAPLIKLSDNLLALPQMVVNIIPFKSLFIFVPILLLLGLWVNTKKTWNYHTRTGFILLFGIFLMLLFLITANITGIGFEIYKSFFKIPGFSMFRNFYGQWMFGYLFFLSLLMGYAIFYLLSIIKNKKAMNSIFLLLSGVILFSALPFIQGKMINLVLNLGQSKEFKIPIKMDPEYEKVLQYMREDTAGGKYLTLPFTEAFSQMLAGTQQGMYQGPSTISSLTGHSDFIGYQVIPPFSEVLLVLARERKYEDIGTLLGLWNVRYIFYNSDENIMAYWPDFPYQHVKNSLPKDQRGYQKFIDSLPVKKKKDFGNKYHIYQLSEKYYLPIIYIPKDIRYFKKDLDAWGNFKTTFFTNKITEDPRVVYIEDKKYESLDSEDVPNITFQKINPTKFRVQVHGATNPYILVLSNGFNPNWKVYKENDPPSLKGSNISYFNGEIKEDFHNDTFFDGSLNNLRGIQSVADASHFMTNAYSNGWAITPEDLSNKRDYTLIIEMQSQRIIYITLIISGISFVILLIWTGKELLGIFRKGKV
jgi:hypothetical protein